MQKNGSLPKRPPRLEPESASDFGSEAPQGEPSEAGPNLAGDVSPKEFVLSALDRYERQLTAYAQRLNHGDIHAARDAVQHAFMKLCKEPAAKIAPKLGPWLYTVVRNRVLDELDSKHHKTVTSAMKLDAVDEKAIDPAQQMESEEVLVLLRGLFSKLAEPQREVIELWSNGFDTNEIADIIDKKSATVRVNLHRAIKGLRQHPQVKIWLERATGHCAKPDVGSPQNSNQRSSKDLTANCKTKTKTKTTPFSEGERS